MIEVKNKLQLVPQLILTPQLQLVLKVLQLNVLELNEYLLQEAQSNPFLEIEFNDLVKGGGEASFPKEIGLVDEFNWEEMDFWETRKISFVYEEPEEEFSLLERGLGTEETLSDHLNWQLSFLELSPLEKEIAQNIIGNLDERGYLRISPEEISEDLRVSIDKVEKVRAIIRKLDPLGVASLNLKECLLAQLEFLGYGKESLPYLLVERHLEELMEGPEALSKKYGYTLTALHEALEVIKALEPYPARNYASTKNIYLEPDLRFYKEEGEWKVEILKERNFKVRLSSLYYKILGQKRALIDGKAKDFLKEKMKLAENLLKALDSRYSTLYKVGQAILHTQKEFLEKGIQFLKPLTLKDLSLVTNLHESTISRVVSHKYVDTPLGIFPLKFFFSTGYQTKGGETLSATAIKELIKEIIAQEDPQNPLSDSEISKLLYEKHGLKIARRTVTKYREELNIPSIRERKKRK